jgi:hypothetical protein
MATTDDLVISIRADLDTLNRQLQQVDQRLNNTQQQGQQTGQSIDDSFSGASDAVKNLAAAIGAAVAAMGAMAVSVANNVREFNSLASSLGLSYTQLERLQSISSKANIETDMMIDLAKTLNEQIGEAANGNKDFEESFSRLGLKMDDLIKMSVDEQLLTVAQALGEVTSQADKAQIGATLFGDNWLPALKLTEQNVKQLADEYEQFSQKLDDTDVTRLIELDIAFDGLVDNVTQISKKISSDLAPALTVAIKKVNELFQSDFGGIDENISVITFLSIEMGAQMINIFTAINGLVKMTAASFGTLGNMIVMGLGAPIAGVMDIYNTNVASFTNALIKAHNAYKELKGEPFTPIELVEYEKTKNLDALIAKVRETKAAIADFAKTGAKDFLSGISGEAGSSFRDEAIAEATKIKERLNNVNTDSRKRGGDDEEAKKKAEELRKAAQELLKQTLESNMSELQLQGVHFQNLLSQLKQFNDQKALSDSEYKAGVLAANEAFNNDIIQQVLDASEKEQAALLDQQQREDEAYSKRIEQQQAIIQEAINGGLTELELMDKQHAEKMNKLQELAQGEFINKQALLDAEFALEQQHQAKRLDLVLGTGSKIQEMTKAFNKSNLQGAIAFFAADFGGFSQHSRKMFELQKAAKLAEAAINLPSSVMKAYEFGVGIGGLIVGAAFGAAALSAQLSQLRAIQSATFGGGSSSGGGGVSAPSVGSVGGGQEQQQQPLTQRFVNINLSGSDNSMYSKGAVRDLITRINEEVKDGAVLRVL